MDMAKRDEIFYLAHVFGFLKSTTSAPAVLSSLDIAIIREIETRLNTNSQTKYHTFKPGMKVRFKDGVYSAYLGEAKVLDVLAKGNKVMLEVPQFFGRPTKMYAAAADLVAV